MHRKTPRSPEPFTFEFLPSSDPRAATAISPRQGSDLMLAALAARIPALIAVPVEIAAD